MQFPHIYKYHFKFIVSKTKVRLRYVENMTQEQPVRHVQEIIKELNDVVHDHDHDHEHDTTESQTTASPTNSHSNVVASQTDPVGVQVFSFSFFLSLFLSSVYIYIKLLTHACR